MKKATIAAAIVLALLLFIALLFVYSSQPAFTVRHFTPNISFANGTSETFAITNNQGTQCSFVPFEVQVLEGTNWIKLYHIPQDMSHPTTTLGPKNGMFFTINNMSLPFGRSYRVRFSVNWELKGLKAMPRRLQSHRLNPNSSLNPFDKNSQFFGMPIVVLSEEWMEGEKLLAPAVTR